MGVLKSLFAGGIGDIVGQVGNVVDKFNLSGEEKQQFKLEMEALLQKRDSEIEQTVRKELEAKERVLVAELSQDDNFTKRARPTVVYVGLIFIFFNYCIVPAISLVSGADTAKTIELPEDFWWAWGGIVATWSVGRSFEKSGISNRATRLITGSAPAGKPAADEAVG